MSLWTSGLSDNNTFGWDYVEEDLGTDVVSSSVS